MWATLLFEPQGRFAFGTGLFGVAGIVPMDGSPAKRLDGFSDNLFLATGAISPDGRLVAAAPVFGPGEKVLRIWDAEGTPVKAFPLPGSPPPSVGSGGRRSTGYEAGIAGMLFESESSLVTAGHGGIRRWDLDDGTSTLIREAPWAQLWRIGSGPLALYRECTFWGEDSRTCATGVLDLATGRFTPAMEALPGWDADWSSPELYLNVVGSLVVCTDPDGTLRIGEAATGPPHVLLGHDGAISAVTISPDLKWVASTGEDNTLRLWPMPDLSKPPLHTLPHDELIAKLKSLTNLRAVPDPAAENGWKIELAPFPGWKEVPNW
jgi:WD40 repeat protein